MAQDVYYIVGSVFATNRWEHWDGQLHTTLEAGNRQVATAREYGFPHFQLYELRLVDRADAGLLATPTPDTAEVALDGSEAGS